jgi:hypothetical protein
MKTLVIRPGRATMGQGFHMSMTMTMQRKLVRGLAMVAVALGVLCSCQNIVPQRQGAKADAAQNEKRIGLRATINGKPARFIFDTGASDLILFPEGAARLGLSFTTAPKNVHLNPGELSYGRTEECNLQLVVGDDICRTRFRVLEMPQMLARVFSCGADGIVGWQPVAQNIFVLDTLHDQISLLKSIPKDMDDWVKYALITNAPGLQMDVSHNSGDLTSLSLDTGTRYGVKLSPAHWRHWKAAHTNRHSTIAGYYNPVAGIVVAEEAWAKELPLASLLLTDVPVMEADKADVVLAATEYQATLGLAALKRLDCIIDGQGGVAYLRAKKTPPPPYEHNRLGAVFTPLNVQSNKLIGHVVQGSPAWEAGIRNGDELLCIGKLDATKWRTDPLVLPLSRFWERPPGSKLEMTLKRDTKVFKVNVVLRQILSPESEPSLHH